MTATAATQCATVNVTLSADNTTRCMDNTRDTDTPRYIQPGTASVTSCPPRVLQRQTRFGFYGDAAMKVHTQPDHLTSAVQNDNVVTTNRSSIVRNLRQAIDAVCVFCCCMAILLFGFSIFLIHLATQAHTSTSAQDNNIQYWVMGSVFLCSALAVGAKAGVHLYKRKTRPPTPVVTDSCQDGRVLTCDSRASIQAIPPSYSAAQVARVPSEVYDMDAESGIKQFDEDAASVDRVTFTAEQQPPNYEEARERALTMSKELKTDIQPE